MGIFGIAKKGYGMLKKAKKHSEKSTFLERRNKLRGATLKEALGPVPRAVPSEGQKKKQVKDFVDIRKRTKSIRQKKKFK